MTLAAMQTLEGVIDEALNAMPNAAGMEIAEWISENYPQVFEEHIRILGLEGLADRIRKQRKKRPPAEEAESSRNLCLDFGLPPMELDTEVSIPQNLNDMPYGKCDWVDRDNLTIADIDKHIELLKAQDRAILAEIRAWDTLRQAAANEADGRMDIPLWELRRRARERRKR